MQRICHSLATHGYRVTLVGRMLKNSNPLEQKTFRQKRLRCLCNKGFAFYAEYNIRLFLYLLLQRMDAICAIDLDTILPCLFVSKIKNIPRIYDAHEYFTELKEVWTRPAVKKFWSSIERYAVPQFNYGYSVADGLANKFNEQYNKEFIAIKNMPVLKPLTEQPAREKFLLFQGAVNEARGFEYLIPAMKSIPYKLVVCGDGNFMQQLKELIRVFGVEDKVALKGMMKPEDMWPIAQQATLGLGLAEKEGLNQFLALPNKFFDYMHACLPQLAMNFPEYAYINNQYKVAVLLDELDSELIAKTINRVMCDDHLLNEIRNNCLKARAVFNWGAEEKKLVAYYQSIISE